jgi:hypothetical protein
MTVKFDKYVLIEDFCAIHFRCSYRYVAKFRFPGQRLIKLVISSKKDKMDMIQTLTSSVNATGLTININTNLPDIIKSTFSCKLDLISSFLAFHSSTPDFFEWYSMTPCVIVVPNN